jgi:hypothetical protein
MEFPHEFSGLDVHRVLFTEFVFLITGDESEMCYVLVQIGQVKLQVGISVEIMEAETGKI